jgi:hypothetical protein
MLDTHAAQQCRRCSLPAVAKMLAFAAGDRDPPAPHTTDRRTDLPVRLPADYATQAAPGHRLLCRHEQESPHCREGRRRIFFLPSGGSADRSTQCGNTR